MANILLVANDSVTRENISLLLTKANHQIYEAATAVAALALLEDFVKFDVVLTDLYMSQTDGVELLTQIKRWSPKLPVIVLTEGWHRCQDEVVFALLLLGAAMVLEKPIDTDRILSFIAGISYTPQIHPTVSTGEHA